MTSIVLGGPQSTPQNIWGPPNRFGGPPIVWGPPSNFWGPPNRIKLWHQRRQVRAKQRSRCPCYIAPTLSPTTETSKVRNVCYCTHEYEWWSKDHPEPAELSEESPGNVQFLGLLVFGVETKFPLPETTVGKLMVTFPDNKYKMLTYEELSQ